MIASGAGSDLFFSFLFLIYQKTPWRTPQKRDKNTSYQFWLYVDWKENGKKESWHGLIQRSICLPASDSLKIKHNLQLKGLSHWSHVFVHLLLAPSTSTRPSPLFLGVLNLHEALFSSSPCGLRVCSEAPQERTSSEASSSQPTNNTADPIRGDAEPYSPAGCLHKNEIAPNLCENRIVRLLFHIYWPVFALRTSYLGVYSDRSGRISLQHQAISISSHHNKKLRFEFKTVWLDQIIWSKTRCLSNRALQFLCSLNHKPIPLNFFFFSFASNPEL